jgi:mxaJ protein
MSRREMCCMSSGYNRRHIALGALISVTALSLLATEMVRPRHPQRASLPTEIVVSAEGMPAALATAPSARTLRVCADPNNLPFSNARGDGFENKIAALAATALNRQLQYDWEPQRRGFIRTTLRAGTCDVIMGVLASSEMVLTSKPYYRSAYAFVTRHDRHAQLQSFDDPRLKRWRIGIQLTGDDYGNPPPAQALASRQIIQNVRGFTVYGDYSRPDPLRKIIAAVQEGSVDTAIVWGPVAGYFGRLAGVPVDVTPVAVAHDRSNVPLTFAISMAVRRGDEPLAAQLNKLIVTRARDIRRILDDYHVPLVDGARGES